MISYVSMIYHFVCGNGIYFFFTALSFYTQND